MYLVANNKAQIALKVGTGKAERAPEGNGRALPNLRIVNRTNRVADRASSKGIAQPTSQLYRRQEPIAWWVAEGQPECETKTGKGDTDEDGVLNELIVDGTG